MIAVPFPTPSHDVGGAPDAEVCRFVPEKYRSQHLQKRWPFYSLCFLKVRILYTDCMSKEMICEEVLGWPVGDNG